MADYIVYSKLMLEVTFAIFCRSMQVFIGLGFPYEGPAPLEAIAQGCIFLNAKVTCELAVKGKLHMRRRLCKILVKSKIQV